MNILKVFKESNKINLKILQNKVIRKSRTIDILARFII